MALKKLPQGDSNPYSPNWNQYFSPVNYLSNHEEYKFLLYGD